MEKRKFEIIIRVFTNDLEKSISQSSEKIFSLSDSININKPFIETYLKKTFILSQNRKKITLYFIGYKNKNEITNLYLESEEINDFKSTILTNSIFFNTFKNQNNMVNIELNTKIKSYFTRVGEDKIHLN